MTVRRLPYLSILLLLGAIPAFAQFGIPGIGYPGGGRRYPRNGPTGPATSRTDNGPSTLVGILRKIEDKDVILETDDAAIDTVSKSGSTKYENEKGGKATIGDFQPGDHVRITAKQDSKKAYHAVTISMVSEGTAEEHATASAATADPSRPIFSKSSVTSSSGNGSSNDDNPNRPVLRRAGSAAASSSGDDDHPHLARASSSGDGSSSTASSASSAPSGPVAPPPMYGNDASSAGSDTPVLRRPSSSAGSYPASVPDTSSDTPVLRRSPSAGGAPVSDSATARPSLHSDDPDNAPRLGQRAPADEDPFIEQARDAAFAFSETLPNYVVKQYTTRYATGGGRGGRTSWQVLDNVTADVVEEDGEEKYKNVLINGKPPLRSAEKTGTWSKGEFSSLLKDLFSPVTNADFHGKRAATIVNRPAWRYEFTVQQPNSHWHVEVDAGAYMPGYSGSVWIDKENYRVLRIEMAAEGMPGSFPLDQVEWAVDYDYVAIGEGRFLLPVHSETLSCERGTNLCSRNVIDFRNYRKFTADSSITFTPE